MDIRNLATVFGPNILRSGVSASEEWFTLLEHFPLTDFRRLLALAGKGAFIREIFSYSECLQPRAE